MAGIAVGLLAPVGLATVASGANGMKPRLERAVQRATGDSRSPKLAFQQGLTLDAGCTDPCAGQPKASTPPTPIKAKAPKPIQVLRGLLR